MALASYHGASAVLSTVALCYPELDLGDLSDDTSTRQSYDGILELARKLEPTTAAVAGAIPL